MSYCDILNGRDELCMNNTGGIKNMYIIKFNDLPYDSLIINNGKIHSMGGSTPTAYKFELLNTENVFEVNGETLRDNGTVTFNAKLNVNLKRIRTIDVDDMHSLAAGRPKMMVEYHNGLCHLFGLEFGVTTSVSTISGGAMGDFQGWKLESIGSERIIGAFFEVIEDFKSLGGTIVNEADTSNDPLILTMGAEDLIEFTYEEGSATPDVQTFNVLGDNLTNDIILTSSNDYELSLDGVLWSSSITIPKVGSIVALTTVYVQLPIGKLKINNPYNETITISSVGATSKVVYLYGNVTKFEAPTVIINSGFTTFMYNESEGPSTSQPFQILGFNLTDNIFLTTPPEFEMSLTSNGVYSHSIELVQSFGSVTKTLYMRLKAGLSGSNSPFIDVLTATTIGTPPITKGLNGVIVNANNPTLFSNNGMVPFNYSEGAGTSNYQKFEVRGLNLIDTLVVTAPPSYEITLDPLTPFTESVMLTPSPSGFVPITFIYIRLKLGLLNANSPYDEQVVVASTMASNIYVNLEGTVSVGTTTPDINVSTTSLGDFEYYEGFGPSQVLSFDVEGVDLLSDLDIYFLNGSDYEVNLTNSPSGWVDNLTLIIDGNGDVQLTTIYVRLKDGRNQIDNPFFDSINCESGSVNKLVFVTSNIKKNFNMTWNITDDFDIELPYSPTGVYTGTIDWGDGNTSPNTYNDRFHTYSSTGMKTVTVNGSITDFRSGTVNTKSLYSINNWGDTTITSNNLGMGGGVNKYLNCALFLTPDTPKFSGSNISLNNMFEGFSSISSISNLDSWDVSNVITMENMFANCSMFNGVINSWNTSSITNMGQMFYGCINYNQPMNDLIVGDVTNMKGMFNGAISFNQKLDNWDTSKVVNMEGLFKEAAAFNKDINSWNTSSVTNMKEMFRKAFAFNEPLNSWNTSKVVNMASMFEDAIDFKQNISSWDFSLVTNLTGFMDGKDSSTYNISDYEDLLNNWSINIPTKNLTANMGLIERTINSLSNFNNLTVSNSWIITDGGMTTIPGGVDDFISTWKTTTSNEKVILPIYLKNGIGTINWGDGSPSVAPSVLDEDTDLNEYTYSNPGTYVITLSNVSYHQPTPTPNSHYTKLQLYEINQWGAFEVKSNYQPFYGSRNLDITATDVLRPSTSPFGVSYKEYFGGCQSLINANGSIGNWNVSNVNNMESLFIGCFQFNVDISNWNFSMSLSNFKNLFMDATNFNQDISSWNVSEISDFSWMFNGAIDFNQDISTWDFLNASNLNYFMGGKTHNDYNATYYDNLLINWATNIPHKDLVLEMGTIKRTSASDAAYNLLTVTNNWVITDGGTTSEPGGNPFD